MGYKDINRIEAKYDGKSWDYWLKELNRKSTGTKRHYLEHMDRLLDYLGLGPEEFYQQFKNEENLEDERDKGQLAETVRDYMIDLERQGYSRSWARFTYKAVSSFFKANKETFRIHNLRKTRHRTQKTAQHEEIRIFVEQAPNLRTKAIITVLKDSGLRTSDLRELRVEHVKHCLRNGANFCFITMQTRKEDVWAYTMLGPESMEYLRLYLEEREREGVESPWLFCNHFNPRKGGKLGNSSINPIFDRLQTKTGIQGLSAHSCRRFHMSKLTADGVDSNWVKLMQGKALDDSMKPYFDPNEIPNIYKSHYHAITIFNRGVDGEEIEALREKVQLSDDYVESLRGEIEELKERWTDPRLLETFMGIFNQQMGEFQAERLLYLGLKTEDERKKYLEKFSRVEREKILSGIREIQIARDTEEEEALKEENRRLKAELERVKAEKSEPTDFNKLLDNSDFLKTLKEKLGVG